MRVVSVSGLGLDGAHSQSPQGQVPAIRLFGQQSEEPFPLLTLPAELIALVLVHLDARTLVRCAESCTTLRDHIRSSTLLQYHLELAKDGLVHVPNASSNTLQRLNHMTRRRRNWAMLTPARIVSLPLDGDCHAYELVGGVFGKAMVEENAYTLKLYTFPDGTDMYSPPHTLVRRDVGVPFRDFALDPYQDLLVLVQTQAEVTPSTPSSPLVPSLVAVYFKTLSDNIIHPLAAKPMLSASINGSISSLIMHVLEHIVAVFGWIRSSPHLFIWDWHAGTLLVSFALATQLGSFDDFTMLSNDTFMLTCLEPVPSLDVYNFKKNTVEQEPTLVVSLQLPKPATDASYFYIGTHTGPFLHHRRDVRPYLRTCKEQLFEYDYSSTRATHDRIHVISVALRSDGMAVGTPFTIFVHNSFLLRPAVHMKSVPWVVWGPENTRWTEDAHQAQWLRYVHGSRFVRAAEPPPGHAGGAFVVLDFGVSHADARVAREVRTQESIIPAGELFAYDIVTSLPYRELARCVGPQYSGYMIDEERILGLLTEPNGNLTRIDAMTF